jgi:hypothetical protein
VPAVALVSVVVSSAFPLLQRRSNNEGTLYFSVVQQSLLNPGAMNGLKVFFLFPAELERPNRIFCAASGNLKMSLLWCYLAPACAQHSVSVVHLRYFLAHCNVKPISETPYTS